MIVLVTGGSGCGKSTWAEKLVSALPAEKRVYIATMQVYDEESVQRVARHRAQREYLRQLAKINAEAAKMADCVVEVVYSIPVCVKGALPCV